MTGMTVGTFEIAHVFDEAEDGDVHDFRHLQGLFDDHGDELLRRRDDEDAVDRQGLEYCQGDVARSRRHVDEHVVDIAPDDVGPELFYGAGNDRSAPYDGSRRVFQEYVHGHDFNARFCFYRENAVGVSCSPFCQAEGLRDGRAGDVGVEDSRLKAAALHLYGHEGRDEGFTYAAFAADDGDDVFYVRSFMGLSLEALRLRAAGAFAAAAGAVVIAIFTHYYHSPFWGYIFRPDSACGGRSRHVHRVVCGRLR